MTPIDALALVDTHAHLCSPEFFRDLEEVLARARSASVRAIISVGENLAEAVRNLELAGRHPMIRPAAGLYPTVLELEQAEWLPSAKSAWTTG